MKLSLEFAERFFYVETGKVDPVTVIVDDEDESAEETAEIVRLPFGFFPPPPSDSEGSDDEEAIDCC